MVMPSSHYRDPVLVSEANEQAEIRRREREAAKSCDGCIHCEKLWGLAVCGRTEYEKRADKRCVNYDGGKA